MKNRVKWQNLVVYPVFVGFTTDEVAFRNELKRLNVPNADTTSFLTSEDGACTHNFLNNENHSTYYIITVNLQERPGSIPLAALIAHEATHVAQQLWIDICETEPGREAEAYLVQTVVTFCLEEYAEAWKNRPRKKAKKKT